MSETKGAPSDRPAQPHSEDGETRAEIFMPAGPLTPRANKAKKGVQPAFEKAGYGGRNIEKGELRLPTMPRAAEPAAVDPAMPLATGRPVAPASAPTPTMPVSRPSPPGPAQPAVPAAAPARPRTAPLPATAPAKPAAPLSAVGQAAHAQARALAATVVASFVERLQSEAARRGGQLSAADIGALNHDFQQKAKALESVFVHSFEEFGKVVERVQTAKSRHQHFDRVMAKQISSLFPPPGKPVKDRSGLSRRVLPGFFLAIEKMIGTDALQAFQDTVRRVVDRIQEQHGDDFTWDLVYVDPEARQLVLDVLARMVLYFEQLDRRREWFLNIVNGNLPAADPNRPEDEAESGWLLTVPTFYLLADTLFSVLRRALANQQAFVMLCKRHGRDDVERMPAILDRIAAARQGN